jgi:hypothetical protein
VYDIEAECVYNIEAMKTLSRLTALSVCALLLASPAAFGCGGPAMMAADCPMVGMDGMGEMADSMPSSMAGSSCHESDQMAEDCCDVEPAPEPIQAPRFETVKLLIALEAADLPVNATLAPPVRPQDWAAPDSLRELDVGRYTLFSSFLL